MSARDHMGGRRSLARANMSLTFAINIIPSDISRKCKGEVLKELTAYVFCEMLYSGSVNS